MMTVTVKDTEVTINFEADGGHKAQLTIVNGKPSDIHIMMADNTSILIDSETSTDGPDCMQIAEKLAELLLEVANHKY
jgi:hypothetical protein